MRRSSRNFHGKRFRKWKKLSPGGVMRLGKGWLARRRLQLTVAAVVAATAAAIGIGSSGSAVGALSDDSDSLSANWSTWQKNIFGSRYNAAEYKINPATVGNLKLKWAYAYANIPNTNMGSQPAIVDGVMYVGSPEAKLLALDAKTGATKWEYDYSAVTGPVSGELAQLRDGPAVHGDSVYFGDSTGRVFSVNKNSGTLNWATRLSDHPFTRITSSPLVFDG